MARYVQVFPGTRRSSFMDYHIFTFKKRKHYYSIMLEGDLGRNMLSSIRKKKDIVMVLKDMQLKAIILDPALDWDRDEISEYEVGYAEHVFDSVLKGLK